MRAALALTALLASASTVHAAPRAYVQQPRLHRGWMTAQHAAPGATADAIIAERAARDFIAQHLRELAPGAAMGDLVVVANHLDHRGVRTVGFAQQWRGMRVLGGQLGVVIAKDRLFAASSSAWPNVTAAIPRGAKVTHVVPRVDNGRVSYEVARKVERDAWDVYLAPDGRELTRINRHKHAGATLTYNAGIRHGGGARTTYPAPRAAITVNGSATTTLADGTFTWTGNVPSTVVTSTTGTHVRVINQAGPSATTTLTAQPGGMATWNAATDELVDAQVSAYVYANIAKVRARAINPSIATWLDAVLDVYVNENGACNAYSTGDDVHLFRASNTCENTARVGDVVFHEVGHSLHAQSVIDGMGAFEDHLTEGLADFFAATITGDSAVGRGYFKSDEPLRDIDPFGFERVYPLDFDFDPHVSGLIIAGALWDLRKRLIADLGATEGAARTDEIFTGIMQRANDISTSYTAALVADDDDANLANGTPNRCAIERAFGAHGLVPGYEMTRAAPPIVDGLTVRVPVTTPTATTCAPANVTSIVVTWRANDGVASQLQLEQQGSEWVGTLPDHETGTVIAYSVDVHFDDAGVQSFPDNPADPRYQLFVGSATKIWCETFDVDPMWQQTSNGGFTWAWGPANADPGTHDPDTAHTGTHVLGTGVDADGDYGANSVSSISTPMIDVSAYETVRLHYWRWLTVEDALFDIARITANGDEVWTNESALSGTLDHIDREWRFHDVDLTPHVRDGMVDVRWGLSSDFAKELGGWTLDDVCVVGLIKVPRCGDGEVDIDEQCDDGNTDSNDGCASDCIDEITAGGGGGCCSTSRDSGGSIVLAACVGFALRRRRYLRRSASSFVPSRSVSLRMP